MTIAKYTPEWIDNASDEDVARMDRIVSILQEFAAQQEGTLEERLSRAIPGAKRYGDYALELIAAVEGRNDS